MRRLVALGLLALALPAAAQQKLGYVDTETVLRQLPEFLTAQQQVDRLAREWEVELEGAQREIEGLEREFAAREVLYTAEERTRRLGEIEARKQEMAALRRRRFGPEGDLFREQQTLVRPIQERVLEAIETVAEENDYDFVFDRGSEILFLYTRPQHNITELVLDELGVDPLGRPSGSDSGAGSGGEN